MKSNTKKYAQDLWKKSEPGPNLEKQEVEICKNKINKLLQTPSKLKKAATIIELMLGIKKK